MTPDYGRLKATANEIRKSIIISVYNAGSGHPGGSLSATEILTMLYFYEMNIDPADPNKPDRDKFVLSKGHATPGIYSTLAERGYFPKEELIRFRKLGSMLQGHPDMSLVPGIEMSTGSLGQGFSSAIGMALANKLDKNPGRIYVLLGDGELQEGIVWEAMMSAGHYKLNNLVVIVDWNGLQIDGNNEDVMTVTPIDAKLKSFGFETIMIDGHNMEEIKEAFDRAREYQSGSGSSPFAIVARTTKGKGVSYMENDYGWHGKAPSEDQAKQAIEELGGVWQWQTR